MRELSLFSGAGGGLLATKHLLGWETVGYVEIEPHCQVVLSKRIAEGYLPPAPIFTDIRTFARRYARRFKGLVDIITAGFPCQPFSVAGRRKAESDDRNMWPQTIKVIRIIRPAFVFLENVPGLLAHEYAITIFNQLAENGYKALPPLKLGADDIGANHRRKRVWILAYADQIGRNGRSGMFRPGRWREFEDGGGLAHSQGIGGQIRAAQISNAIGFDDDPGGYGTSEICGERSEAADVFGSENVPHSQGQQMGIPGQSRGHEHVGDSECMRELQPQGSQQDERRWTCNPSWWDVEPGLGRVANGVANRVDRLKAIGNGQVPAVVRAAWELLTS